MKSDHYATLGVSRDANSAAIRNAFRRASMDAHPDREGGSNERMQALNDAYAVLSDRERRTHYDATGFDDLPPPIDFEAREMVLAVVSAALDYDKLLSPFDTLLSLARSGLENKIAEINTANASNRRALHKLAKQRRMTKAKSDEKRNFFHDIADQRIVSINDLIAKNEHRIEVAERALKMLEESCEDVIESLSYDATTFISFNPSSSE